MFRDELFGHRLKQRRWGGGGGVLTFIGLGINYWPLVVLEIRSAFSQQQGLTQHSTDFVIFEILVLSEGSKMPLNIISVESRFVSQKIETLSPLQVWESRRGIYSNRPIVQGVGLFFTSAPATLNSLTGYKLFSVCTEASRL